MRDPNRLYSFYNELNRIHIEHFPDWRFGQLMSNFMQWLYTTKEVDCFFPEEDRMIEYLKEFSGEMNG